MLEDFHTSISESLEIIPNPNLNSNPTEFKTVIDVTKDSGITLFSNPVSNDSGLTIFPNPVSSNDSGISIFPNPVSNDSGISGIVEESQPTQGPSSTGMN